jgi:hypothetical protein
MPQIEMIKRDNQVRHKPGNYSQLQDREKQISKK